MVQELPPLQRGHSSPIASKQSQQKKMAINLTKTEQKYDRESELKAFDETKAGVKGLLDSGITKIPRIFIHPSIDFHERSNLSNTQKFPLIDLKGIQENPITRKEVIEKVREASETWGFFQVINHGIPGQISEEMLDRVRKFYEQDDDEKKLWYTRERTRRVLYNSNFDLYNAPSANWRDTFYCQMAPDFPDPDELPLVCRDIMTKYTKEVLNLGTTLFQLLSESLGLKSNHLEEMKCGDGLALMGHYYPKCPQPELTLGTSEHADSDFMTVLLNDKIDGLQVLHQDKWIDVPFVPGSLLVNIGDLLQLMSNDKFISAEHRVLASSENSRVSVACFFRSDLKAPSNLYGPIDELWSDDNPAKYRATTVNEYVTHYNTKGMDGNSALLNFRV